MLWLDKPLWGRWLAAATLIGLAVWFESRPPPPTPTPPVSEAEAPTEAAAPAGWWSFPADLAPGTRAGDRVLVLIVETGEAVEGIVAASASDDPFGSNRGLVALPAERAAVAAAAAAVGGVVILHATD